MWLPFASSFCWACTSLMLRGLASRLDGFLANGLRAVVGLFVVVPFAMLTVGPAGYATLTPGLVLLFVSSVILGGVIGDSLYISALPLIGISRAFPIANTYPLFTLLFSVVLLGLHPTPRTLLGLLLVMAGVYLVARPRKHVGAQPAAIEKRRLLQGVAMVIATAILWGLNTVVLSIGLRQVPSAVANTIRMPVVALGCLLMSALRGRLGTVRNIDRSTVLLVIATGLWGSGLGSTLYVGGVRAVGPTLMATIGAASPLFAVPLSAVILKERPTRRMLVGTSLTILGVVLVV